MTLRSNDSLPRATDVCGWASINIINVAKTITTPHLGMVYTVYTTTWHLSMVEIRDGNLALFYHVLPKFIHRHQNAQNACLYFVPRRQKGWCKWETPAMTFSPVTGWNSWEVGRWSGASTRLPRDGNWIRQPSLNGWTCQDWCFFFLVYVYTYIMYIYTYIMCIYIISYNIYIYYII